MGACLALITLAVYSNTLANGFVFDDHALLQNARLRSLSNLIELFKDYRPLRDVSYAVDFALWKDWSAGFHLTNILLHAANVVLVFLLVYRITKDLALSGLAALIFAVHPIQTDPVAYVSGRRDLLFAFFFLLAFHCYLSFRGNRSVKLLALTMLCWVLSLTAKEMAASFPLFVFLWAFISEWKGVEGPLLQRLKASASAVLIKEKWIYLTMLVIAGAGVYLQAVLEGGDARIRYGVIKFWGGSLYSNILTALHVQGWYLKQLIYPTPIIQYSGAFDVSASIADWRVIVSLVVLVSVLAMGLILLKREPLMTFCILSYFVLLLPVSQAIPHHELLADHYLYLPLFSFSLLLSVVAGKLSSRGNRQKWATASVATAVLVVFIVMTVRENAVWKDDRTLWQANYAQAPNSPRAVNNVAVEYLSLNPGKARDLFRRCVGLDPTYGTAYFFLATLATNQQEAEEVESLVERALEVPDRQIESAELEDPGVFRSQLTTALAIAKRKDGDQASAESLLWNAISIYPSNPMPYDLLAELYSDDKGKQVDLATRELDSIPDSIAALRRLSVVMFDERRYDQAIGYLNTILSLNPNDAFANCRAGQIYLIWQNCPEASAHLKIAKANAKRPEDINDVASAMRLLVRQCGTQ
jgi:tetratricopeptide (TPR) repeat protein